MRQRIAVHGAVCIGLLLLHQLHDTLVQLLCARKGRYRNPFQRFFGLLLLLQHLLDGIVQIVVDLPQLSFGHDITPKSDAGYEKDQDQSRNHNPLQPLFGLFLLESQLDLLRFKTYLVLGRLAVALADGEAILQDGSAHSGLQGTAIVAQILIKVGLVKEQGAVERADGVTLSQQTFFL